MPLNNGKHIVEIIDGKRCSLVETGISESRMNFLKELLEINHYEVRTEKDVTGNFKMGVTDIIFNPAVDVYKRQLKSKTGHIVTPSYWLQLSTNETEAEVNYWTKKKDS